MMYVYIYNYMYIIYICMYCMSIIVWICVDVLPDSLHPDVPEVGRPALPIRIVQCGVLEATCW